MVILRKVRSVGLLGFCLVGTAVIHWNYNTIPRPILHCQTRNSSEVNRAALLDRIPHPIVRYNGKTVDCMGLFDGTESIAKYENMDSSQWQLPDEYFLSATTNCPLFIQSRQYIMEPLSTEEANFPLAFSLLVYRDVHQVEQLLRAIYRPQNVYCIHVDNKTNSRVYDALHSLSQCFDNVLMSSERYAVHWGGFSVLHAELRCLNDLWKSGKRWRYFINLTGQEFPLKTNLDLVQILKAYNGSNAITFDHKGFLETKVRVQYQYNLLKSTGRTKAPPPHNIQLTKGNAHVVLTRSLVDYVLHNKIALDFEQWIQNTKIPDEMFFNSLNINPKLGVPGAFTGDPTEERNKHPTHARYKQWVFSANAGCKKVVRYICMIGLHEMPHLIGTLHMFANKFLSDHEPVARMCLEQHMFNRTRAQVLGGARLNLEPYRKPTFVKHHSPS